MSEERVTKTKAVEQWFSWTAVEVIELPKKERQA